MTIFDFIINSTAIFVTVIVYICRFRTIKGQAIWNFIYAFVTECTPSVFMLQFILSFRSFRDFYSHQAYDMIPVIAYILSIPILTLFLYDNYKSTRTILHNFTDALKQTHLTQYKCKFGEIQGLGHCTMNRFFSYLFQNPYAAYPYVYQLASGVQYYGDKNKLDIYVSSSYKDYQNLPVFVFIHGGGWLIGSRKISCLPLLFSLAESGWMVVAVGYNYGFNVKYPEHIDCCKEALNWVYNNIGTYKGNRDFIVLGGESAGSYNSLMVALNYEVPFIRVIVDFYGVHDLSDSHKYFESIYKLGWKKFIQFALLNRDDQLNDSTLQSMSPTFSIKKKETTRPLFISLHGTSDYVIPIDDSIFFSYQLNANDIDSLFIPIEGASHCFNYFISPRSYIACDIVIYLINIIYNEYLIGKKNI